MSEIFNIRNILISNVSGDEYINRREYLESPIMWWENDKTQLNATNLNKMSMGIRDIQREFKTECGNMQDILTRFVNNSAGWMSTENENNTAEVFNDYENNRAIADYTHAQGYNTQAGFGYLNESDLKYVSGFASHAQGIGTVAVGDFQFVLGRWNILDTRMDGNKIIPENKYAVIVGGGVLKEGKTDWKLESDVERKNIHTLDWDGNAWFANNIATDTNIIANGDITSHGDVTVDGNLNIGTDGYNRHLFNGKTWFKHSVKIDSNLGVYGNVKLGTDNRNTVTINSATTLKDILTVEKAATLKGTLNVEEKATIEKELEVIEDATLEVKGISSFKNNVTFDKKDKDDADKLVTFNSEATFNNKVDITGISTFTNNVTFNDNSNSQGEPYNVTINSLLNVNNLATFDKIITAKDKIRSESDFVIITTDEEGDTVESVGLQEVYDQLDYKKLDVGTHKNKEGNDVSDDKTVPNAIAKVKSDLIGKTALDTQELTEFNLPITLSNESIYGVAQFSINLLKSLLNAYIWDKDDQDPNSEDYDPEKKDAIDKLVEIASWIVDDKAGAAKIVSDVSNLQETKLDALTFTTFKSSEYDVLAKIITDNKSNWDTGYKNNHTHTNKSVLDGIKSTDITNWDTAYGNNHTHSNKGVLDGISADDVSSWTTAAQDVKNIKDAIGKEDIAGSILNRLKALEDKLDNLIQASSTFDISKPDSWPENEYTKFVIKY